MQNLIREQIKISELEQGMTVEVNGKLETVSMEYVKYNSFMGWSYKGDASKKEITLVKFKVPTANGIVLR